MITIAQPQYENVNKLRKYPFSESATMISDEGEVLPNDLIVDASIFIEANPSCEMPQSDAPGDAYNLNVFLTFLHASPFLITASFSCNSCANAVLTVAKSDFTPYTPYKCTSPDNRMSMYVVFGDFQWPMGIKDSKTYKFSSQSQACLCEKTVVKLVVSHIMKFVDVSSGKEATGDVEFYVPNIIDVKTNGNSITFSAGKDYGKVLPGKMSNPESQDLLSTEITSINGVSPNENGEIAIVFGRYKNG